VICPVCKTNNKNQDLECCVQCGADLNVHRLLFSVTEGLHMQNEELQLYKDAKKLSRVFIVLQIIRLIALVICTVFGIFFGMQFLTFLGRSPDYTYVSESFDKKFEQLQQMNSIIKQQIELIIDQRHENQALQAKLQVIENKEREKKRDEF
jgi:hypothetical protein